MGYHQIVVGHHPWLESRISEVEGDRPRRWVQMTNTLPENWRSPAQAELDLAPVVSLSPDTTCPCSKPTKSHVIAFLYLFAPNCTLSKIFLHIWQLEIKQKQKRTRKQWIFTNFKQRAEITWLFHAFRYPSRPDQMYSRLLITTALWPARARGIASESIARLLEKGTFVLLLQSWKLLKVSKVDLSKKCEMTFIDFHGERFPSEGGHVEAGERVCAFPFLFALLHFRVVEDQRNPTSKYEHSETHNHSTSNLHYSKYFCSFFSMEQHNTHCFGSSKHLEHMVIAKESEVLHFQYAYSFKKCLMTTEAVNRTKFEIHVRRLKSVRVWLVVYK